MISEFNSNDCDELSESLANTEQVFRQLEPGEFMGQWRLLELPGISIVHDEISHQIYNSAAVADGFLIALIPIRQPGYLVLNRYSYDQPSLFIGRSNTRPLLTIPGGFMSYTIEFDLHRLCLTAEALGLAENSDWYRIPDPKAVIAASRLVTEAFCAVDVCSARSPQEKSDAFIKEWLKLMSHVAGRPEDQDRSTLARRRCATIDAANFMLDNLGRDLSLTDIYKVALVSERTLRNGFQELFGMSPMRWLKCERLSAARKDLKAAESNVNLVRDVAVKYGFTQFAHFSTDYRKQFGESPSETLRR